MWKVEIENWSGKWNLGVTVTGNPRKTAQGGITGLGGQNEQKEKLITHPWAYFQGVGAILGDTSQAVTRLHNGWQSMAWVSH